MAENNLGAHDLPLAQRVDSIIAALEPPVTREAVAAIARKAEAAAHSGPPEGRAEWAAIARELALRLTQLDA